MPRRNIKHIFAILLGLALATPCLAERADRDKPIVGDAAHAEQNGKTGTYTLDGDVRITQGTMIVACEHAVMVQSTDGDQHVTAIGHPATFRERMENGTDWLDGHSDSIEYDSKSGVVKLIGKAWLRRGTDELNGAIVTYNSLTEVYTTDGAPASNKSTAPGRVQFVIQPKKKPAPANGPTPPAAPNGDKSAVAPAPAATAPGAATTTTVAP